MSSPSRRGFTLVEVVVSVVLIAVLAVAVVPVVVQQVEHYRAVRMAAELNSIRKGVDGFYTNTGTLPRFIDHLTVPISASDSSAYRVPYRASEYLAWNGPYLHQPIDTSTSRVNSIATGFGDAWIAEYQDARVRNRFRCFDAVNNALGNCAAGAFLVVRVEGLRGSDFDRINQLVDGEQELTAPGTDPRGTGSSESRTQGRLRFVLNVGSDFLLTEGFLYYLLVPFPE